jgi:hypothetical protein
MIRHLLPTFLTVLALVLAASNSPAQPGAAKPTPGQKSPRFTSEALELFCIMTQGYDLNATRYSANADLESLVRFTHSDDADIREIAEMSRNLKVLHMLNKQQGQVIQKAFETQAEKWPGIFAAQIIKSLASDGKKESDIHASAKLLEKLMGTQPQKVVNEGWRIAYLGNELSIATADKMAALAQRPKLANAAPKDALQVRLGTDPKRLGLIDITNRTDRTLHNCLILTRLSVDREFVRTRAAQEDLVGKLVLPLLGFSKATILGSREAARLRSLFAEQDKGAVLYLAELAPGATMTTSMSRPDFYLFSKGVYASLWCDEFAAERQDADNFADAKLAVQNSRKGPPKKR